MKKNKLVLYSDQYMEILLYCIASLYKIFGNLTHVGTQNVLNSYLMTIAKPTKSNPCLWERTVPYILMPWLVTASTLDRLTIINKSRMMTQHKT